MRSNRRDDPKDRQASTGISAEIYRNWILRARGTGDYFSFDRTFYGIVKSKLDALFLQDLLNLATLRNTPYEAGMFLCTVEYLRRGGWSVKEQENRIKSLRNLGYLKIQRRGIPGRRWASIDIEAIELALDAAECRGSIPGVPQLPPNGGGRSRPNGGDKKKTSSSKELKKTNSPASPSRFDSDDTSGDEPMLPLMGVPVLAQPTPANVTDLDVARTERIHARCKLKGWLPYNKPAGQRALARLRRKLGGQHTRIDDVLDFVERKDIVKPSVRGGAQLASPAVWAWLTDLLEKDAYRNPTVQVSPEAKRVARRLAMMGWPMSSESQLPAFVQLCVDRMLEFRRRLISYTGRVADAARPNNDRMLLAIYATNKLAGGVVFDAAEDWARRVNKNVANWKDWSGDLNPLAWSETHKEFTNTARGWAAQKFGKSDLWDTIMKELR